MAKETREYEKFSGSSLAKTVCFLGKLLSALILIPGILMLANSFIAMFKRGITNPESWKMMAGGVIAFVACLVLNLLVNFIFQKTAKGIANAKRKKELKKRGIDL